MKSKNLSHLVIVCAVIISNSIFSQLAITQKTAAQTKQEFAKALVQLLVGTNPNVTITAGSESITGYDEQFGSFTGGTATNFLLDKGIIITSGTVDDYNSLAGNYRANVENGDFSTKTDALLAGLVGKTASATFDAAELTFKFKTNSNKISFKYIFGSLEYPKFVCSDYFDVFGFFISGPDPNSAVPYNNKNIALINNKIVCINTINSGNIGSDASSSASKCASFDPNWASNNVYYTNNLVDPADPSNNARIIKVIPRGYSKILTATADILCNTEYTIKLKICDILDGRLDSYVYLEEGSFKTSGLSSEIRDGVGNVITGSNVSVTEGCNKTTLDLIVSPTPTSDFPITYSFKTASTANTVGSSASGTYTTPDFKLSTSQVSNPTPESKVIIPANTNKASIIVEALKDGITENPNETVIISLPGTCGAANSDITITIKDQIGIAADSTKPTCTGATVNNDGKVENVVGTGGTSPYTYNFNTTTFVSATSPNSKTGIPATSNYKLSVKDAEGCIKDLTIDLSKICSGTPCTKPNITVQPTNARQCEGLDTSFTVRASGTTATSLTYQWKVDKGSGVFVDTVNAKSATLKLLSLKNSWNNYKYKCIITESNGGCKDSTNIVSLTVDGLPTAVSTRDTTLCVSEPAIVGGASFTYGTAKWTKSSNGGGILTNDTQKNPTYTPVASDAGNTIKLTMKVTKATGSTCPNPADVDYDITYDSLPLAKILSDTTICYTATAPVLDAKAKYGTISWATSTAIGPVIGTITNSTTTSETFTPDIKDTSKIVVLTMTVTSNNACQLLTTPAKATATFDVTVVSPTNPVATAGGDTTICMGTAAKVSGAKAKNGTIQWVVTHGNGTLTDETTLTPTYQSTNNDTLLSSTTGVVLTMTVSPAGGCTGSPVTAEYKIKVKSNPKVIPTATTVCLGADASLNGNTITGGSYTWTGPNGYLKTTNSAIITAISKADSGLYQLMIKDALGCKDSANVRVKIHPTPTIVGDTFACVGSSVTLSASNSIATSWVSQIPANLTIDPATGVATGVKGGVTKVEFTDANGCKDDQLILTEDLPVVDFTVDSTSICIGNDVKFTDKSPIKNTNIIWDFGDGVQTNDIDPAYTYQKVDSFTVSLTSISPNLCEGKLTKTKYITPIDVPTMKFGFTPDSIDNFNPEIQFINYSTAKFFTWNFGDYSPVSYEKNPLHTFPETPGQAYKVTLKGSNSLSGVCPISVYHEIVSIDPAIYFIPNSFTPNGDEINNTFQPIFTSGYDPQNYSFWIYNRLGQLVFESHNAAIGWDGTYGGKLAENNTYVWKLQFKSKQTEKEFYLTGHVNLVK